MFFLDELGNFDNAPKMVLSDNPIMEYFNAYCQLATEILNHKDSETRKNMEELFHYFLS